MKDSQPLVLEILKQGNLLSMSLFEQKELSSTIRHYHQASVSLPEINRLCQENIFLLNKSFSEKDNEQDLLKRIKKVSQLLWDHLLTRQVREKLRNIPSRNLILFIDEELINIPWEFLYDGKDFLCLKFALGRLVRSSSNTESPQYRALNNTLKMLILANPTNDLNSAYAEGKFIRNHFDHRRKQVKINFKSTQIESLYVKKNLHDYDIVHFAGHAEHDQDNPQGSGWVLSDGKFSAQDIRVLGEAFSLPHLVFSNACHSAQLEDLALETDYQDKTYNLAAAFLFSGVRHYIGCAWKIEDRVSLSFAKEFYTLLIDGECVGECVRRGRLKLIDEFGPAANFWASHLLYGDPNFVFFSNPKNAPKRKIFSISKAWHKPLFKAVCIGSFFAVLVSLYLLLPTRNPKAYMDFLKARHFLSQGQNLQAVSLSRAIIARDPKFLGIYPLLADTYQRLGDRSSALKAYFEYLLQAQKGRSGKDIDQAYTAIAWVYHLSGEYAKALDFYQQAIKSSTQNNDKLNQAVAMRKMAVWYIDKEDYDKALELLTKSSEINRERQQVFAHRYNLACDNFDLGLVFTDKGDMTAAAEFYRKAKSLFEKLKLKDELSDFYFNQGEIFLFEKEYQKALEYYLRGLAIDRQKNDLPAIAVDYDMLGELYLELGDTAKAEESYNLGLKLAKEINAVPELASLYYNLGLLSRQQKHYSQARDYFRQAQELYRKMNLTQYREIRKEFDEVEGD
ncbi:MAG: CHAT domain-containing protein [Candidatus Omnitrophica bacterium]|nr:CHAT domain-containing protein [Candidatus Omnitrophota bacterium]